MMHRRPIIAALSSLLVGLSSQLGGAHGFATPTTNAASWTAGRSNVVVDDSRTTTIATMTTIACKCLAHPRAVVVVPTMMTTIKKTTTTALRGARGGLDYYAAAGIDPNELIARRIVVVGDVDGGYYRSCVKNEVSRKASFFGSRKYLFFCTLPLLVIYIFSHTPLVTSFGSVPNVPKYRSVSS